MARFIREYSLSLTLAALLIVSWLFQTAAGWIEFVAKQQEHGSTAAAFGPNGYFWIWAESTFENWQSEFLQLFTFVVLTAFLIHRKSHESRDADDEMQSALTRIEKTLDELQKSNGRRGRKESKR